MAQGRGRQNSHQRTSCVSPMWKHSTANNVVTLKMRPTQTTFTSLDTFMAAHSPRRFCQGRQKYILKPLTLDKRISESGFAPVQKDTRSNSGGVPRLYHGHGHIRHHASTNSTCTATDSSSEGEHSSQRVLALGKCRLNNGELVQEGLSDPYRSAYFRPGPKVPMIFNRTSSIPTTSHDTSDLIAIGTIPITSQRQTPVKPMSSFEIMDSWHNKIHIPKRVEKEKDNGSHLLSSSEEDIELTSNKSKSGTLWKTKATLNLKGCKYPDPMVGASPSFQARITEMAQLELETIRFEKTKKTKKKASSS